MVATLADSAGRCDRLLVAPHAPLSRSGSLLFFALVSLPILAVAVACGLIGNWYVLPFSLAVIAAIGAGLRAGYRRTQLREVILVVGPDVVIERGHRRPEERHVVPCRDARVVLEAPKPDAEAHLFIRTRERRIELGDFLDDGERRDLANRLGRLLGACGPPAAVPDP